MDYKQAEQYLKTRFKHVAAFPIAIAWTVISKDFPDLVGIISIDDMQTIEAAKERCDYVLAEMTEVMVKGK